MNNFSLYGLTVNDLYNPVGIDEAIRFSWKLDGRTNCVKQSAYRLVVRLGEHLCYDSKKTISSQTVDIPYLGEELQASARYDVEVTVWNEQDESESICGYFETGLKDTINSYGAQWISNEDRDDGISEDISEYTISCSISVNNAAMGILFGRSARNDYYMTQLRIKDDHVQIAPHIHTAKGYATNRVDADAVDLTVTQGLTPEQAAKGVKMQINVTPKAIVTLINGKKESELVIEQGMPVPVICKPGVRTAGRESGAVSDFMVTDTNGETVFVYDFSTNPFSVGNVQNGTYSVAGCGEIWKKEEMSAFRRRFNVSNIRTAKLYVSSLGIHQTFINGERVYRLQEDGSKVYTELLPGFTQVEKRKCYFTFDVTHMLKNGENVLSSTVSCGWWSDDIVVRYGDKSAYWAILLLTDDNGRNVVVTDTSWKSYHNIPLVSASVYSGETYDARISDAFMYPDFNDDDWDDVVVNTEFTGVLSAHRGTRTIVRNDLERHAQTVKIWNGVTGADDEHLGKIVVCRSSDGFEPFTLNTGETAVVDFGQNFAGREFFTVSGKCGTAITVRHGEMLNDQNGKRSRGNDGPEGSVYTVNLRSAKATTHYTLRGENDTYRPLYTFYGFRYLSITATAPVKFEALCGEVLTNVEYDSGCVETGNADVNRLIQNARWGMYSNYLSVPTDCPQRNERLGWTADTQVFTTTASYFSTITKSFLGKWLLDLRDAQGKNGGYTSVAPSGPYGSDYGSLGWADAGILVPYYLYKMYGSTAPIYEMYASMQQYVDGFLASTNGDGPLPRYGDWLSVEPNDRDLQKYLGVCYYAFDALAMAQMADAIGKTSDAERYRQVYEKEKAVFCERYVREDGSITLTQQTAYLFALKLGLLPNEESVKVVKTALQKSMDEHGYHVQTGFLGTSILAPTLSEFGMQKEAYKLLLQTEAPSWLYSVKAGATTIWERWNSYSLETGFGDVGMNSFNHYAYGVIGEWLFRYAAGISPVDGFKSFRLAPEPDISLGHCSAKYDSAFGQIVSEWKYADNDRIEYHFVVPANTTADIVLQNAADFNITGGDLSALNIRFENDNAIFTAEPGEYNIVVNTVK